MRYDTCFCGPLFDSRLIDKSELGQAPMPLDDAENLSRFVQQHKKAVVDFQQAVQQLGSDKDAAARDRMKRLRPTIQSSATKVEEVLQSIGGGGDDTIDQLRQRFAQAKKDFDSANVVAKKKERSATIGPNDREPGGNAGPRSAASTDVRVQEIKLIDNSELNTKEALENDKLQGAIGIQNEMHELKSTYQEFNDLVSHQQVGLDRMSSNISESRVFVEKGIVEIQQASKHQKSSRKKLCILLVILVVAGVVIGVVVYLSTRGD